MCRKKTSECEIKVLDFDFTFLPGNDDHFTYKCIGMETAGYFLKHILFEKNTERY